MPYYQPQQNRIESIADEDYFGIRSQFTKLNSDFWIEISVRDCIKWKKEDSEKYILSVECFEQNATKYIVKDKEYQKLIDAFTNSSEYRRLPSTGQPLALANFKYTQLVLLCDRAKPEEKEFEV